MIASGEGSEGDVVWISTGVWQGWEREVGNQATIAFSTETLLSDEMQTWRARGHWGVTGQMGKQ